MSAILNLALLRQTIGKFLEITSSKRGRFQFKLGIRSLVTVFVSFLHAHNSKASMIEVCITIN